MPFLPLVIFAIHYPRFLAVQPKLYFEEKENFHHITYVRQSIIQDRRINKLSCDLERDAWRATREAGGSVACEAGDRV